MLSQLENFKLNALKKIETLNSLIALEEMKSELLGKKSYLNEILKTLGSMTQQDRKKIGEVANLVKTEIFKAINEKRTVLENAKVLADLNSEQLDTSLPGRFSATGKKHILTQTIEEISEIFENLGFSVARGPDVENEFHNFTALNIPADHPARDMHDTFYLENGTLLRTHTSPVQVRVMKKTKPPLKIIVPGTVYRCDNDMSHSPVFNQIEGLYVDEGVTFSDLKGVLNHFIHAYFGKERKVRFRPSYFPFTEPSAEVDVECGICQGKGCPTCKNSGWLEILGSGMVNKNVFRACDVDPIKYTGFAFGMGIERIAILKYGITDIRLFYENDVRFLRQF